MKKSPTHSITKVQGGIMLNKLLSTRVLQVAGSLTLCAFAIASQAAPLSLTGSCHLTSTIPGKGECLLTYFLHENNFTTPSNARRSIIKIDGIIVSDWVNDKLNPVANFATYGFNGVVGVGVECGMKHYVDAFIAPVEPGTPFVKVGSLPQVLCPVAP